MDLQQAHMAGAKLLQACQSGRTGRAAEPPGGAVLECSSEAVVANPARPPVDTGLRLAKVRAASDVADQHADHVALLPPAQHGAQPARRGGKRAGLSLDLQMIGI